MKYVSLFSKIQENYSIHHSNIDHVIWISEKVIDKVVKSVIKSNNKYRFPLFTEFRLISLLKQGKNFQIIPKPFILEEIQSNNIVKIIKKMNLIITDLEEF